MLTQRKKYSAHPEEVRSRARYFANKRHEADELGVVPPLRVVEDLLNKDNRQPTPALATPATRNEMRGMTVTHPIPLPTKSIGQSLRHDVERANAHIEPLLATQLQRIFLQTRIRVLLDAGRLTRE